MFRISAKYAADPYFMGQLETSSFFESTSTSSLVSADDSLMVNNVDDHRRHRQYAPGAIEFAAY